MGLPHASNQRFTFVATLAWALVALAPSCISRSGPLPAKLNHDEPDAQAIEVPNAVEAGDEMLPPVKAHSVSSVSPSSGSFKGGVRAVVRGNGFKSTARVWFGEAEVPSADTVPIDPNRVQVVVPAGKAGPVDVSVQNGDDASTKSTLAEGFVYDPFYAEPSSGPTSGGIVITLFGDGTNWELDSEVLIDLAPCTVLAVRKPKNAPQELDCRTPAGSQGAKTISVTNTDGARFAILSGFSYGDSNNGFLGGLSGAPLDDTLSVVVLDNVLGEKLPGAVVILGDEVANDTTRTTDESGVATFKGQLGPERTVTIAKKCFQPLTFVGVPVDHVTAYLDPVLSPACAPGGDPPVVGGGRFSSGAAVTGELVWKSNSEFQGEGWTNVPNPISETEKHVAYLFELARSPTASFILPRATLSVTPEDRGDVGYKFRLDTNVGNLTLYALAGVEDRSKTPVSFSAYAMGLVRGVAAEASKTTSDVFIAVDNPLDHSLVFDVSGPVPTERGPDQVQVSVAVRVGNEGFAILPKSSRSVLLPVSRNLEFVGVPALVGSLAGAQYVSTASAVTGSAGGLPESVIGLFSTNNSADAIKLDGFLQVPRLVNPASDQKWDGRSLAIDWAAGGALADLTIFELVSGGGLVKWTVVARTAKQTITLPNLMQEFPDSALIPGGLAIQVSTASIDDFDYANLRYSQLSPGAWSAYASDAFSTRY